MPLSAVHDTIDEVPEQYRDLYTEKNGKYELTGILGVKTQGDIDRLSTSLQKERDEHKSTKERYSVWADMDHNDVMSKLDRMPELEAAAKGKLDEAQIEEMVTRRTEGTIKSRTAPLERQVSQLQAERDTAIALAEERGQKLTRNAISGTVREALVKAKVIPEAQEDALMLAERVFEVREDDGAIVTRDNVGVVPGMTAEQWLQEMSDKRPHWWPGSQGSGARGGGAGGNQFANNPWNAANWNLTEQGKIITSKGREYADRMAQAAGTTVGGPRPKPAK